jgi:hypothetical protein
MPDTERAPECNQEYGRWVPGGDAVLEMERLALQVLRGVITYEQARELACATKPGQLKRSEQEQRREWVSALQRVKFREEKRIGR